MEKTRILKAPHIQHYIDWLRRLGYGRADSEISYDSEAYILLDELYQALHSIAPMGDRNRRELWLKAERGSLDDWGKIDEMIEDGEFDCREEAECYWKDMFPEKEYWYNLTAIEDDDTGFRGLFLGNKYIIEVDPRLPRSSFPYRISDLVSWLLNEVQGCIAELKAGTYNERISRELPYQYRTGTILRKDFYDLYPEERVDFFRKLSDRDRQDFARCATSERPSHRLPKMTANDFYQFCAYGYEANAYTGTDLSPREQYNRHADGRDDGLGKIDPDSPEAFFHWLTDMNRWGGHPWEVCRGGNSTHVALYVYHDDDGYFLELAGSSVARTIETVKFFLALYRRGIPVRIRNANILIQRVLETEKIGIVPVTVIPTYCEAYFPKERIISFRHLPEERRAEAIRRCVWKRLPTVFLNDE